MNPTMADLRQMSTDELAALATAPLSLAEKELIAWRTDDPDEYHRWRVSGGYLEEGETVSQARRKFREEGPADV